MNSAFITSYERDTESDLDFAQARYYSSKLGRFYSVDPENAGASEDDPQSWNGYAYGRNNPVLYSDPDGLEYKVCNNEGQCWTHDDGDFKKGQKGFPGIYQETGRDGYYDSGIIKDSDGNKIGTYERTSIDRDYQFVYGVAEQSVRKAKVVGGLAAGAAVIGACIGTGTCAAVAAIIARNRIPAAGVLSQGNKVIKVIEQRIADVLKNATPGKISKVKQFHKSGGTQQAQKDFNQLTQGAKVQTRGQVKIAELGNGVKVNVRPNSNQGSPTLEIQMPKGGGKDVKIRYGN